MQPTNFAALRTELDVELNDADNFTFTSPVKDEIIRQCIEDDADMYVLTVDSTNVTTAGTYNYTAPFDLVYDIKVDAFGAGALRTFDRSYWSQTDDQVTLTYEGLNSIPTGTTLYMYGADYFTRASSIPGIFRPYIIANAVVKAMNIQMNTKVNRFLRNDTSIAELTAVGNRYLSQLPTLRRRLRRHRPISF